jgi:Protein of unknown function (DUF3363)
MARCADAPQNRGRISRQYRETLTRISGRNVPIPTVSELALLPWQGAIEKPLGRGVSGLVIEDAVDWQVGRRRGPGLGVEAVLVRARAQCHRGSRDAWCDRRSRHWYARGKGDIPSELN